MLPRALALFGLLILEAARPSLSAPSYELARGRAQCLEQSCFSIFWAPKRFQGAERMCERLGDHGHLMTVRSSVSADIISLLLLLSTGVEAQDIKNTALWMGLQRPPSDSKPCPEPSSRLRGFQWVTGDAQTDYANWRGPVGDTCKQSCAVVQSDLTWEERDCDSKSNGFLCEFTYPSTCRPLGLDPGLTVTYITPFKVEGTDFMALPPDTEASISPLGIKLWCHGNDSANMRWQSQSRGPWACQVENGGCSHVCQAEGGPASCLCPPGLDLAQDGRDCVPPPDPCSNHACEQLCFVNSTDNTPHCMCHEGFELGEDGASCQDIDDCQVNKNICDQQCVNTVGGFNCVCHPGYELQNGKCQDVDECYEQVCEHTCENLPGSFQCSCLEGYVPLPDDPSKCQIFCNASECKAECDLHDRNSCRCPQGYILNLEDDTVEPELSFDSPEASSAVCVDVDECTSGYCDQLCENTPGSFNCSCEVGYTLQADKMTCVATDGGEEGSTDTETPTDTMATTPDSTPIPPKSVHVGILIGIVVGILSMVSILIAIALHLARKHTVHSVMDYKCKHGEKGVVLQQVTKCPSTRQKL